MAAWNRTWGTVVLVRERIAYHAGMVSSLFSRAVCFGAMSLLTYGSGRHREELLPRIVRGELLFLLGLTESGAQGGRRLDHQRA